MRDFIYLAKRVGSFISMYTCTGPKFSIYFVEDCSNAARISNANLILGLVAIVSHHIVK